MNHEDFKGRGKSGRNRRIGEATRARHPHFESGFGAGFGPGFPGFPGQHPMHGFGPMGPRGRRRPKGDVRAAILSLLAADETASLNGYGIMKAISEQTEGVWSPSPGSVYPTLQQLVDEGLIGARGEGRTTEYSLTEEGRAHAAEHAEEIGAWTRVPGLSDATRTLMQNAGRLMAALGQFRMSATDAQREAAAAKLEETRKALYLILAE